MFNIGFGEILVLVVLGLLVFGPDRLPDAVRRGTEGIAWLRRTAADARQQVSEAAGLDDEAAVRAIDELRELHPKRIASSVLNPSPAAGAVRRNPEPPAQAIGLDPDLT